MDLATTAVWAVIGAMATLFVTWLTGARQLQVQVNILTEKMFVINEELLKEKEKNHKCELERADDRAELSRALHRIGKLEIGTGIGGGEPGVGLVIADLKGIIRVFSPSLTPVFRWLPQEVIGKPITMLMPPDSAAKYAQAFKLFVADEKRSTDSSRIIFTEAVTKTGNRFKVAISLDGWQVGSEGLITATVREQVGDTAKG